MLAYLIAKERGAADLCLAAVAERLQAEGHRLAGAVQVNSDAGPGRPCDMDLSLLGTATQVRISQRLGALSDGCRLDPDGLETAVGLVGAALASDAPPALMIVNKFGRQEALGRGFRPLVGQALGEGIPVLLAVTPDHEGDFAEFAAGLAEPLPAEPEAILRWCRAAMGL